MSKKAVFVIAICIIIIIVLTIILFDDNEIKDYINSNIDSESGQSSQSSSSSDSSNENNANATADNGNSDVVSSLSGGGGGGGGSGSSDSSSGSITQSEGSQPSYSGNDCGVSSEILFNSNLNLSTELDEAQTIVLNCMSSSLNSCSNSRVTFYSGVGNPISLYQINGTQNGLCLISGVNSQYQSITCSFSNEAINQLSLEAEVKYPSLSAAKSYEVLSLVNAGGGLVNYPDNSTENVVCS